MIKLIVFLALIYFQTTPIPIHFQLQPKLPLNINLGLWLINFTDKSEIKWFIMGFSKGVFLPASYNALLKVKILYWFHEHPWNISIPQKVL